MLARVGFRICVPVLLTATVLLAVGWTRPMLLERLATAPATYVMVVAVATVMAAAVTVRVITGSDLALVIGQIAPPVAAVTLILIV